MKLFIPTFLAADVPNATLIESTATTIKLKTGEITSLKLPTLPRTHIRLFVSNVTSLSIFRYGIVPVGTVISDLPNSVAIEPGVSVPINIWVDRNKTVMMRVSTDVTVRVELIGELS